jgi:5'-nucleotidase (lipoprotein e(P4) family)|tara:strand:- start:924 stop:1715 length:792 start_codon:yes stop_codon:yes gene_type:complete
MKNKILKLLIFLSVIISCNKVTNDIIDNEYKIQSLVWTQNSAEYEALCYQAFNAAKFSLDNILSNRSSYDKPLAIITDVDETVLDNSPYDGKLILNNSSYNKESWVEWGKLEIAEAIPGSLEFFKYASENDVEIFYISNRYTDQINETVNNLKSIGFPNSDNNHVLLREKDRSKSSRRSAIFKSYDVVMLLGDNLSDFSDDFENKISTERNITTNIFKKEFGKSLIMLPNPNYGDWESNGLFEGNNYDNTQKDSVRKSKIKIF